MTTEKLRLALGKAILAVTQKRVGVAPVVLGYDDNLIKAEEPDGSTETLLEPAELEDTQPGNRWVELDPEET